MNEVSKEVARVVLENVEDPKERWRLREQIERHGQAARLLDWGIDTVHYHVSLDWPTLRESIARCEAWVDAARPDVTAGGVNGYSFTIHCADGLRILVCSGANPAMGMWVIGGAGWCLQREANSIEFDIVQNLCGYFDIAPEVLRLRLRRVDVRFDFNGDLLAPWANLDNVISQARLRREVYGQNEPHALYGSVARFTGAAAGKGDVRARFYDKVAEAESGTLERWQAVWDYQGDIVWRIEYQLRKDFLTQFEIENMRDFFVRAGDLVQYMLSWFRFAEVQARKDIDRPLLPWWAAMVETIKTLDLMQIGAVRRVIAKKPDAEQARAQLVGNLAWWWGSQRFNEYHNQEGAQPLNEREELLQWDFGEMMASLLDAIDQERERIRIKFGEKVKSYQQFAYS